MVDGIADQSKRTEEGLFTPLELAKTPNMDWIAR
jgi:2,3-bisphosphoglycerate-independent phosphoglycerate mutase